MSTLVTTVFDGPIESQIEIAIKFYDLIMAKNDTRLGNLKCASVNLPKGYIDFDTKKLTKKIFDLSFLNGFFNRCSINQNNLNRVGLF